MAADVDEPIDDGKDEVGVDDEVEEDEFEDSEDEEVSAELEEFDDPSDVEDADDDEEDIEAAVALSGKEQNARSLEIRRAIEERMEERRFHEDVDYLDFDLDE